MDQQTSGPGRCHASRRTVLGLAGAATAGAVAGCATDSSGSAAEPDAETQAQRQEWSVSTSEIPIEGGAVFDGPDVVVTQPEEGTFVGFSAECTHQGCTVTDVSDGTINCACHGSAFDLANGSVVAGPAEDPLRPVELRIEQDTISVD
ncbi:Rieske (2Fe-2S) protein [Lipingzhangella sp. LS1_29]|uniref:Cytochrome bc1 complex Rieske iron-sulfur subunit n=1 Tax=Lipingzhangella rawalii TaxID=2055835 RepID=A0ABU2HA28_9ACTN|nr:Rieske (2Fe-2S) protein [Lipingzhangella rawalii]MDS1272168.1 Rieske (2Fe-2S) protein [Lipingzhangella rawalii]